MLLIFVTETTESNNSDVMYINKYLNTRFHLDKNTVIKWIYMNGKANYEKGNVLKRINDYVTGYRKYHSCSEEIHVIYCIDVDVGADSSRLNRKISDYCEKKGYHLVWFNQTIEHVFLGKLIHQAKEKKTEARNYYKKQLFPKECCDPKFNQNQFVEARVQTSNIGCVLEELFRE